MIDALPSIPQLLPLLAAVLYAVGAMLFKRAADLGVGAWRTAVVSNVVCAAFFQPLLLLGGEIHWRLWWQPVLVALTFIAGQAFTFVALQRGDVSVATPMLGIKILLVALLVTLVDGERLGWRLWVAAALATAGIALLNRRGHAAHHHVGFTIVNSGLAAACFALFDVLVQTWSPVWGLGRFLPISIGIGAALTCVGLLRFPVALRQVDRKALLWLLAGAVAMGAQSLTFVSTIAHWGHAAPANITYSSRGLWSVLLVWLCGHWVASREQHLGSRVLGWRLAGAALMMAGIVLVLARDVGVQP